MPLSAPTERFADVFFLQNNVSVFSPTGTIPVGSLLVLLTGSDGTGKLIQSVSDDAGNTWTVDAVEEASTQTAISIASCIVTHQLTASSVITITWPVAVTGSTVEISLQQVSGALAVSPFDRSAGAGSNVTNVDSGFTAALTQADEIVFGLVRAHDPETWTHGVGYSDVNTPSINSQTFIEYKIVSATTAVKATGTIGAATHWSALVVTYKAAAGSPSASISASPSASTSRSLSSSRSASISSSRSASISRSISASPSPSSSVSRSLSSSRSSSLSASRSPSISASISRSLSKSISSSISSSQSPSPSTSSSISSSPSPSSSISSSPSQSPSVSASKSASISSSPSPSASLSSSVSASRSPSPSISPSISSSQSPSASISSSQSGSRSISSSTSRSPSGSASISASPSSSPSASPPACDCVFQWQVRQATYPGPSTYPGPTTFPGLGSWVDIPGATDACLKLTVDDLGKFFRCIETCTNHCGSTSVVSNIVGPVTLPIERFRPESQLGCGHYEALVLTRGGGTVVSILPWTTLSWQWLLDDTSTADVGGLSGLDDNCCREIAGVRAWEHELAIYRNDELIWVGPITRVSTPPGEFTISARDLTAWWDHRLIHSDIHLAETELATVFTVIHEDALAPDPSPNFTVSAMATGIRTTRNILALQHTLAGPTLRDLSTVGIDWTAIARVVHAGPVVPTASIGTFTDDHFVTPPTPVRDGGVQANRWIVRGAGGGSAGDTIFGDAADGTAADLDGLLESVDSNSTIADYASAQAASESHLHLTSEVVTVENCILSPDAPFPLDVLVPGALCELELAQTCIPVSGQFKLKSVGASPSANSDNDGVTLVFQPVGADS